MTQPTKPADKGVNEQELQKMTPPTKEVGGVKRSPVETPNNDKTFSK